MVLVCYSGIKENACNIFTQKLELCNHLYREIFIIFGKNLKRYFKSKFYVSVIFIFFISQNFTESQKLFCISEHSPPNFTRVFGNKLIVQYVYITVYPKVSVETAFLQLFRTLFLNFILCLTMKVIKHGNREE
jgi:hypothetical protein